MAYIVKREKTATGKEIEINNVLEYKDLKLYGDAYQYKQNASKNMLSMIDGTYTKNNVTATVTNGFIFISGSTSGESNYVTLEIPFNKEISSGQTVTVSAFNQESGNILLYSGYFDGTAVTKLSTFAYLIDEQAYVTYSNLNQKINYFYIDLAPNETFDNYFFTPQIELGSSSTDYEPYSEAIPSPDTPSEIQTVTGSQNVIVRNTKNMFDINAITTGKILNTGTGLEQNSDSNHAITDFIQVDNTKSYMLSGTLGTATLSEIYVFYYDFNNEYIGATIQRGTGDTGVLSYDIRSYTGYNKTKSIRLRIDDLNNLNNLQLEKGNIKTNYEPYQGRTYEINLGKNLFDEIYPNNALTYRPIFVGNGTFTLSTNAPLNTSNNANLFLLAGKVNSGGNTPINGVYINRPITVTTTDNYVTIGYRKTYGVDPSDYNTQLEKGSTVSPYSAYKTPIELCKIGDARDYIYKYGDDWYLHKEVGKVTLDGSEDGWTRNSSTSGGYERYYLPLENSNPSASRNICLSNYFMFGNTNNVGTCFINSSRVYLYPSLNINTLVLFETWLSTHNTDIYYQLLTPTNTQITDSELIAQLNAIELYTGTNYISTSSINQNGELEINYYYDTKYDEIIYSGDAKHKIKIWFDDIELEDADRYCEKLTRKSMVLPEDGKKRFSLDNFISQEIEIIFHNINASIIKDQVRIEIGTLDNGNEYDYIPLGIFNIQGTPTTDKNKVTIKLRDNRVKFDIPYDAKPIIDAGGGTATKKQILNDICTKSGVTSDVTTFYGEDDPIGIYDNTINGNIYVSYIAEQAGVVPIITREGHLDFVSYANSTTHKIPLSILEKYEIGTPFTIQRVVYEDGIVKYETSNDETLETLYLNGENPYISRQEQIDNVFTNLGNFTLDSVTAGKLMGNPAIDPWDLIEVYGYYDANNHFVADENTIVFKTLANQTMTYTGKITTTYKTQIGLEERKENVTLSGEGTFRKYAKTEIDNINGQIVIMAGDIEDVEENITELITTEEEQTGLPMYIENAEGGKLIDLKLYGDTYQETYSGKNLFKPFSYTRNNSGIDFTYSIDGSINANGTATATARSIGSTQATPYLITLSAGTYTISGATGNDIRVEAVKTDGTGIANTYNTPTFTINEQTDVFVRMYIVSGTVTNNVKVYPQLEKGSTATSYEKYVGGIPSPNPEYPQIVQTVTGKQEVEVVGENIFVPTLTADGTNISHPNNTPTLNADEYSLVASGTDMRIGEVANQGVAYSGSRGTLYEVADADTIYLYCTNSTFNKNYITWYDENKVSLGYNAINNSKTNGKKVIENAKYFTIRFGYGSAVSGTTYTTKVMVSRNKITDYVPYTSSKYELNLGKNLFDKDNVNVINCSMSSSGISNTSQARMIYIPITGGNTYTISKIQSSRFRVATTETTPASGIIISDYASSDSSTSITVNTSSTANYLCAFIYISTVDTLTPQQILDSIQIEKGSVVSLYSPYKTPIELCKVGAYQDIIKKSTGKNLFDKDNANTLNAYFSANTPTITADNSNRTIYISCNPNTTYTISKKASPNGRAVGTTSSIPAINSVVDNIATINANDTTITYTTNANAKYLVIRVWNEGQDSGTTFNQMKNSIQIELGDTPTDIEPYGVGKWYVSKKIGKVVLDGNESWTYSQSNVVFYAEVFNNKPTNTFFYTTYFTYIAGSQYSQWTNGNCGSTTTTRILCKNTDYTDATQFKNWLSTHNVDVYYQYTQPSYEEITDEELINQLDEIELLTGINNVSITSENLPADAYMKYYLKTPLSGTYVKHEEMNAEIKVASDQIVSTVSKQTDEKLSSYATKTELSTEIQQTSDSINARVNKLYTNINQDTGEVESVTTTTGYKFDADGLSISRSDSEFSSLHDNTGTYYKDNDKILSQTTKDGTITKDMVLYGKYYYGVDDDLDVANFTKDDAMFIAELYTDGNNEVGFGHFVNKIG